MGCEKLKATVGRHFLDHPETAGKVTLDNVGIYSTRYVEVLCSACSEDSKCTTAPGVYSDLVHVNYAELMKQPTVHQSGKLIHNTSVSVSIDLKEENGKQQQASDKDEHAAWRAEWVTKTVAIASVVAGALVLLQVVRWAQRRRASGVTQRADGSYQPTGLLPGSQMTEL